MYDIGIFFSPLFTDFCYAQHLTTPTKTRFTLFFFQTTFIVIAASVTIALATEHIKLNSNDEAHEINGQTEIDQQHDSDQQQRTKRGTVTNHSPYRVHVTKKMGKRGKKISTIHLYPTEQDSARSNNNDNNEDDDDSDQDTNETHTHEEVDDSNTSETHHHKEEKYKVKIKHHHHHHHHNHVKTIVKKEPYPVEKIVHVPKPYPVEKIVEKVVHVPVEKIVHVPMEKIVRVPYEKIVHIAKPYPVEKIVEKIVHVPKPYPVREYIEKPIHIEKKVPYPVEKIVEVPKPYPVEKIVEKIVHVPKPYPVYKHVHVPVEVKVPVPVPKPYAVEKKVPYPVEVKVHVEKKVPYPVKVYVPHPHPAEKFHATSGPLFGHHGYGIHQDHHHSFVDSQFHGFGSASNKHDQHTEPSIQRNIAMEMPRQQQLDHAQPFNGQFGQKTQHKPSSTPQQKPKDPQLEPAANFNYYQKHSEQPTESKPTYDSANDKQKSSSTGKAYQASEIRSNPGAMMTNEEHKSTDISAQGIAKVRQVSLESSESNAPIYQYGDFINTDQMSPIFVTPSPYTDKQYEPTYGMHIPEAMSRAETLTMAESNTYHIQAQPNEMPYHYFQFQPYQTYQLPQGFTVTS